MKSYNKERFIFTIKDFFRDNKWFLIAEFCLYILGFGIAVAVFGGAEEYNVARGRAVIWWIVTISVFFLLLFFATFSKYLILNVPAAFVYLGYRTGTAAAFLTVAVGIKGFFNFILIYFPISVFTFFSGSVFLSLTLPYLSSSPKCCRYPNCAASIKNIFFTFSIIYAINLIFAVVWILFIGIFVDVIYVNPV